MESKVDSAEHLANLGHGPEFALYAHDHSAWLTYAAPRIAHAIEVLGSDRLIEAWQMLKPDTQSVVWVLLNLESKALIGHNLSELADEELVQAWRHFSREIQQAVWRSLSPSTHGRLRTLLAGRGASVHGSAA